MLEEFVQRDLIEGTVFVPHMATDKVSLSRVPRRVVIKLLSHPIVRPGQMEERFADVVRKVTAVKARPPGEDAYEADAARLQDAIHLLKYTGTLATCSKMPHEKTMSKLASSAGKFSPS